MKVLLFHPKRLPPKDYGGVERVVLWLARGLVERGHRVWIGASPGSELPRGVEIWEVPDDQRQASVLLERLPSGVELVHFMAPPEVGVLERLPCAGVLTVHGNGKPGEVFPANSVFLSADHARRHGAQVYVYNGIDPAEYAYAPERKADWYLFLSKTSWSVKNLAGAMRLCARARVPLRIAGGNRPWWKRLETRLRPDMRWEGPVAGRRKAELIAEAKALVFPVLWPEPFGLVVAEALMSGTPVIASRRGSLPELVPPDVGALPGTESEWLELLRSKSLSWDPARCRAWAMEKFHFLSMAESYEKVYQTVLGGKRLHASNPVAGDWRDQ